MDHPEDLTAQERVALVMYWLLADREIMRTIDVAQKLGMSTSGAWRMMQRIRRQVPQIALVEDGFWKFCNGN